MATEHEVSIERILTDPLRRIQAIGGNGWTVAIVLDSNSMWWEARERRKPSIYAANLDLLCERVARRMDSRKARA